VVEALDESSAEDKCGVHWKGEEGKGKKGFGFSAAHVRKKQKKRGGLMPVVTLRITFSTSRMGGERREGAGDAVLIHELSSLPRVSMAPRIKKKERKAWNHLYFAAAGKKREGEKKANRGRRKSCSSRPFWLSCRSASI